MNFLGINHRIEAKTEGYGHWSKYGIAKVKGNGTTAALFTTRQRTPSTTPIASTPKISIFTQQISRKNNTLFANKIIAYRFHFLLLSLIFTLHWYFYWLRKNAHECAQKYRYVEQINEITLFITMWIYECNVNCFWNFLR